MEQGNIIPSDAVWRKPLRSVGQGACVEVAILPRHVAVRDSKDRSGPALVMTTAAWASLMDSLNHS
ncbi:DUF397 domain-containing protein [Amycolatopsis decaplanina]|uniref:DUF397 domain-containing protein n=1 Tax=Amycolatopsis decaplanina DSM 44594 TaxID=1284240 RepID=M2ZE44_9PSEU|nr:DUF397 domain-containing protein [Amycolatopsis decaplanina]EME58599.1 hypothetical protein H074_18508 [Amycolatopsis decaplanina DSM 44594]